MVKRNIAKIIVLVVGILLSQTPMNNTFSFGFLDKWNTPTGAPTARRASKDMYVTRRGQSKVTPTTYIPTHIHVHTGSDSS